MDQIKDLWAIPLRPFIDIPSKNNYTAAHLVSEARPFGRERRKYEQDGAGLCFLRTCGIHPG
jgi:hypothetical protein